MNKPLRTISCPACSHKHRVAELPTRCASCGAALRELLVQQTRELRRYKGFSVVWLGAALCITGLLTVAIVMGLPQIVRALDFEGSAGMMVAILVWFASGLLLGLIAPGKASGEAGCAALLVAIPTVYLLIQSETVKTMPLFLYLLMAALGVFFAVIGSLAGLRIQLGPDAKG